MFKVGKKYTNTSFNVVRECVWANATSAALFCEKFPGLNTFVPHEAIKVNPEDVEPLKGYVNVYGPGPLPTMGNHVYSSRESAEMQSNRLKTIEVSYVPEE